MAVGQVARRLEGFATWRVTAALVLAVLACTQGFAWRLTRLRLDAQLLDARGWYSPVEVAGLMETLGADGRSFYALTQLTLDVVFPLAYGLLFAILIVRLYPPGLGPLALVPMVTAGLDLLENITIAGLAVSYEGAVVGWAWVASSLTALKSALLLASVLLVLLGVLRRPSGPP